MNLPKASRSKKKTTSPRTCDNLSQRPIRNKEEGGRQGVALSRGLGIIRIISQGRGERGEILDSPPKKGQKGGSRFESKFRPDLFWAGRSEGDGLTPGKGRLFRRTETNRGF